MSSLMFDYTEPSVTTYTRTYIQGKKMFRFLSHDFSVVRLYRTICNYIFTWKTKYVEVFHLNLCGSIIQNIL